MHYAKILLVLLFTVGIMGTSYGQNADKMEAAAMEKVEKLNQQIIAGDASAALTEKQMAEAKELFLTMSKEIRAIRKGGEGTEEERKEKMQVIRKAAYKKMHMDIMTKEQRAAKRTGKE